MNRLCNEYQAQGKVNRKWHSNTWIEFPGGCFTENKKGLIWYRVLSTKMSATNLWYNRRLRMCGSKISEIVLRKVCMVIRIATDTTPQQWKMATEVYLQMHSHHGTCVLTCGDEITYSFMLLISRHHWSLHYDDVIMSVIASQITSLTIVYSTVYSDSDQRKHQSSTSLAFVWGIHRDRWIPRTKGQLRGKCFHLMTSSCSVVKPQSIWLVCARCYWCGALMISIFIVFFISKQASHESTLKQQILNQCLECQQLNKTKWYQNAPLCVSIY